VKNLARAQRQEVEDSENRSSGSLAYEPLATAYYRTECQAKLDAFSERFTTDAGSVANERNEAKPVLSESDEEVRKDDPNAPLGPLAAAAQVY